MKKPRPFKMFGEVICSVSNPPLKRVWFRHAIWPHSLGAKQSARLARWLERAADYCSQREAKR